MDTAIVTLRMPAELRDWLSGVAREQHRSLSAQVVVLLEHARDAAPAPARRKRANAERRATRLPEDFAVTPEMVEWARLNVPGLIAAGRGKAEMEKFRDHWRQASGPTASKRDWVAAWRNWMRKADEAGHGHRRGPSGAQRETDDMFDRAMARARMRSMKEAGIDAGTGSDTYPLHQGALPAAEDG